MARKATPAFETERKVFPQKLKRLFSEKFDENGNPISQKALADYLGVSRQSVGYYMQGQSEPSYEILVKIAQFFGVTIDYLLTETPLKSLDPTLSAAASYTGLSEDACLALHSMADIGQKQVDKVFTDGKEVINAILNYSFRPRSFKAVFISQGEDIDLVDSGSLESYADGFIQRLKRNPRYGENVTIKPADEIIDKVLLDSIQEEAKAFRLLIIGNGPEMITAKGNVSYSSTEEAANGEYKED